MFVNQNSDLLNQVVENEALFGDSNLAKISQNNQDALEPTLENLKSALNSVKVQEVDYLHEASGIIFKIIPMSSAGYTALNNVEQFSPTGAKVSSNSDDERERNLILLTHGIARPKLSKEMAQQVLSAPGWGPSNVGLLDAIQKVNPAAYQRLNDFIVISALCKYLLILLNVEYQTGKFEEKLKEMKLKPEISNAIVRCAGMFSDLFDINETSINWGVNLNSKLTIDDEEDVSEEEKDSSDNKKETVSEEVIIGLPPRDSDQG